VTQWADGPASYWQRTRTLWLTVWLTQLVVDGHWWPTGNYWPGRYCGRIGQLLTGQTDPVQAQPRTQASWRTQTGGQPADSWPDRQTSGLTQTDNDPDSIEMTEPNDRLLKSWQTDPMTQTQTDPGPIHWWWLLTQLVDWPNIVDWAQWWLWLIDSNYCDWQCIVNYWQAIWLNPLLNPVIVVLTDPGPDWQWPSPDRTQPNGQMDQWPGHCYCYCWPMTQLWPNCWQLLLLFIIIGPNYWTIIIIELVIGIDPSSDPVVIVIVNWTQLLLQAGHCWPNWPYYRRLLLTVDWLLTQWPVIEPRPIIIIDDPTAHYYY